MSDEVSLGTCGVCGMNVFILDDGETLQLFEYLRGSKIEFDFHVERPIGISMTTVPHVHEEES